MTITSAMRRSSKMLVGIFVGAALVTAALAQIPSDKVHVDIPSQSLSSALTQFGRDTGTEIVFAPEAVSQKVSAAVKGDYPREKAISLLLGGTGLSYRITTQGAIVINAGAKASGADAESGKDNISEIVVTGSRIPTDAAESAQRTSVYTREQIEQSGQSTLSDFFNTLPAVSVNSVESFQAIGGGTTVQLHGLPYGTTLVLINGRRTEVSGIQGDSGNNFFDLNNLPLAAIERIEVVSEGSSAVYGSDAIAGVVNIILRKDFNGFEANVKYGGAVGTHEWNGNLAWGKHWDEGFLSVVGSTLSRSELLGSERAATSSEAIYPTCPLANIFSTTGNNLPGTNSPYAAVSAGSTAQHYISTPGSLNQCSLLGYESIIPITRREGLLIQGGYDVSSSVKVFTEILYSHSKETIIIGPPLWFGEPGYQQFTVPSANPYNPYGQTVGVSQIVLGPPPSGEEVDTDYFRPLIGASGDFATSWHWEVAAWESRDQAKYLALSQPNGAVTQAALDSTDPATALDPFAAGAPGSAQLLNSLFTNYMDKFVGQTVAASGFLRGPLFQLPSGPLDVVVGSEYYRDTQSSDNISDPNNYPGSTSHHRNSYAIFGETRIPILTGGTVPQGGGTLAATVAGRYDHYSDFGGKTTPQFGAEWRPLTGLLVHATYAQAFKAPSLFELYTPVSSFPSAVSDPLAGGQNEAADIVSGGNVHLRPEIGQSRAFGIVYSNKDNPNLQLSVRQWSIGEKDSIQQLGAQTIVDNEALFPSNVVRASNCTGGPPCPITEVNNTYVNFGQISVAGIDYGMNYKTTSAFGQLTPSLNVTQTYRYREALAPGSPIINAAGAAQDSGNWAPKWKGTLAVGWNLGSLTASVDARYVGPYQDYDATNEIGNFWLFDASCRWAIGETWSAENKWLRGTYIQIGGVNLANRLPSYSNFSGGTVGYDPAQADIRGRFLYAQFGAKL
jgi:iron complex outermembrane recepter protein